MNETATTMDQMAALASYLKNRRDSILKKWREAVKRDAGLTNTAALSTAQFYDHIPPVLDAFECNLSAHDKANAIEAAEDQKEMAAEHGLNRWHHGYNQQDVMREWGHLHLCLVGELEAYDASKQRPDYQSPGEGIGLSIVKKLCELLDASLEFETERGKGSTFRVIFPRSYDL